jgi:hypothetical protein
MIQRFAFLIFSSSPQEIKYIIPAIITQITAITEVYFIISEMIFAMIFTILLFVAEILRGFEVSAPIHPGRPAQLISGGFASVRVSGTKRKQQRKRVKYIFFIKA